MKDTQLSQDLHEKLTLLLSSNDSFFVTGRAGTGKSTLLRALKNKTHHNLVVLAPTGVAAVNVGGATIHSFFRFRPDVTIEKAWAAAGRVKDRELYTNLEVIVIDEVSMVRADLLDCVDAFLRRLCRTSRPFGGKRLLLFGDLYQLPPVVTRDEVEVYRSLYPTPFFFSSSAVRRLKLRIVELTHIYRQREAEFIEILNALRQNTLTTDHLARLNTRVVPDYAPPPEEHVVLLTGTNASASSYNTYQLHSMSGDIYQYSARSSGEFDRRVEPSPRELVLKRGAQVMLTANDREKRFINGTVGRVEDIDRRADGPVVSVRVENGDLVDVAPHTWEMYRFSYNSGKKRIESEVAGSYTQLPLMLAWSVTIHKAQGKTFDRVIIDLPRSFAHGQTYVALSRATSLSGLFLRHPLTARHVITDPSVAEWLRGNEV